MYEPLTSVEKALAASLNSNDVRDVQLYAFSKRTVAVDGSLRINRPMPVLAISSVLRDTAYFASLLDSGFAESFLVSENGTTAYQSRRIVQSEALPNKYDYESDSDLDDCEEPTGEGTQAPPMSSEDNDSVPLGKPDRTQPFVAKHYKIMIPNMAHRTVEACVFFMYTGKVNFLPLNSQGKVQRHYELQTVQASGAPACSPKSLYRLADVYGMWGLQNIAFRAAVERLTPNNVVQEAFSEFFCRYDALHEHAMTMIASCYTDSRVQNALQSEIEMVLRGERPYAKPTLQALLGMNMIHSYRTAPSGGGNPELSAQAGETRFRTSAGSTPSARSEQETQRAQSDANPSTTRSTTTTPGAPGGASPASAPNLVTNPNPPPPPSTGSAFAPPPLSQHSRNGSRPQVAPPSRPSFKFSFSPAAAHNVHIPTTSQPARP